MMFEVTVSAAMIAEFLIAPRILVRSKRTAKESSDHCCGRIVAP